MALKYVGNGTFLHNVPARDLSDKEEERYAEVIEQGELDSGRTLYEKVKSTAAHAAAPATVDKGGKQPSKE
jgi:hypothetical protein